MVNLLLERLARIDVLTGGFPAHRLMRWNNRGFLTWICAVEPAQGVMG